MALITSAAATTLLGGCSWSGRESCWQYLNICCLAGVSSVHSHSRVSNCRCLDDGSSVYFLSRMRKCSSAAFSKRGSPVRISSSLEKGQAFSAADGSLESPNPQTVEEAIEQARKSVQRAISDGKKRQLLQFLLPVDQRQFNYLDTEPRDYPCGISQEFQACCKVVASLLQESRSLDQKTEIVTRRIGEVQNEMDPVGLLYPSDKSIAAIVFPIAETLKQVRSLAESDENRPLLLLNPQWRASGQIVSDFGFGPWKRQAEEFLQTFETTYMLLEQRIGEASNVIAGSGGVVRILKCYPYDWHVYLMAWDGTSEIIAIVPERPSYKQLEELVTKARKRIPWKSPPRILGGSEPAPPPLPSSLSASLSDEQIEAMDSVAIRRALMALNLPSSGRIAILKDRLKEAQRRSQSKVNL
ncbi:hypothetical protein O6H91_08G104000 [Diphasiastrum complanatum]|uniref:Uncharacterized protein n=1 Tax=Diphasiastrum complanatum TaxID=34168 RepID=A0ACC2D0J5_DIPCM|nr:hypothetical protein O6H91_08G104000 [Diphasiastrum complanatum]